MKNVLCILFTTIIVNATAQDKRTFFKLTDTAFTVGSVYSPAPLYFYIDSHGRELQKGQEFIDSLADFIKAHPGIIIQIGAHTDQRGSDSANLKFSQGHAQSFKTLLLKKGIPDWQIPAVGFGESQPLLQQSVIESNKDKTQRELLYQNERRTEFKILRLPVLSFSPADSTAKTGAIYRTEYLFDFAKASLRPEQLVRIDSLVDFLNRNPSLKIAIHCHTDTRGTGSYSMKLSSARAKTVNEYLVSKGIAQERIIYRGFEGTQPLIPDAYIKKIPLNEAQEQLHQINRRTEIQILQQQ